MTLDHPDEISSLAIAKCRRGGAFGLGSFARHSSLVTRHCSHERLFYPFGELWTGSDLYSLNPHQTFAQLPDYDNDSNSDLYNTLNRHYTPMGRWLSPDPGGVKVVKLDDPQTWNMYAYVRNNPTTLVDPTGLCDVDGEHHGWLWCGAHALGLVQTQTEQAQEARDFFTKNVVFQNGKYVDPNRLSNAEILQAFKSFNAEWQQIAQTGGNPANVLLGASAPGFVDLTDPEARTHILEGDEAGGGHRAGTGRSGKSEFPGTWSDQKILNEVSDVATDPNSKVTIQGNTKIIDGTREGVDIRVIVRDGRIVTGYPTNIPRNP
jgi:RHS repeat-associated protein